MNTTDLQFLAFWAARAAWAVWAEKFFFSTLLKDPTHMHQCFLYLVQVNLFQKHYILASTNPQFDKRLFIELQVQYIKIASSEQVVYINCSECQNKNKKQFVYTKCSDLAIFMYVVLNL